MRRPPFSHKIVTTMKSEKKLKKRKIDARLESPAWREYLANPEAVPAFRGDCSCVKAKCDRHGQCRDCYAHHAKGKMLPSCLR